MFRDKISELTSEVERAKRAVAAKEELEVSQIEAVYRLTTANKKMETELTEVGTITVFNTLYFLKVHISLVK